MQKKQSAKDPKDILHPPGTSPVDDVLFNQVIEHVSENGLGMPKGYQKKLFKIFTRQHTHVEGSGVGLYIIKRIVDNAGGKIEVDSQQGKGTIFRVYF